MSPFFFGASATVVCIPWALAAADVELGLTEVEEYLHDDPGKQMIRGIRGATTAVANTPADVRVATRELIGTVLRLNRLDPERIASILFTSTPDLDAAFPATAVRELGWSDVPVIGATELAVPGSLQRCIRILMHVNTERSAREIHHVYLGEAGSLRPDLAGGLTSGTGLLPGLRRLAIIGLGQMGGSLAAAVRARLGVVEISGYDREPDRSGEAERRGLLDRVAESAREAVEGADLVVLAVPVDATVSLIGRLGASLPPQAMLTDVASAKGTIVRAIRQAGLECRWAGLHPMAGSERAGLAGHDAALFAGSLVALTPLPETEGRVIGALESLIVAIGARSFLLDPADHDRAVAHVSHLPHLLAAAMTALVGGDGDGTEGEGRPGQPVGTRQIEAGLAAGSFADVTRVAASDPLMVSAMLHANRDGLRDAVTTFRGELARIVDLLDDPAALRDELARRAAWRRGWRGWNELVRSPRSDPPPDRAASTAGRPVPPENGTPDGADR